MIYVLTATKTEAQALVEHFRLKKKEKVFLNENMEVHISGVGVENAKETALSLRKRLNADDKIINIGIAAAPKHYRIGELVVIKEVCFEDERLSISDKGEILFTCKEVQHHEQKHIVDMEGFIFAKYLQGFDIEIYKVVSDHFEPEKVKKDMVKKLIKATLKEIF